MHSLLDSSRSTSEAFTIIATELIEVKAMLMALTFKGLRGRCARRPRSPRGRA